MFVHAPGTDASVAPQRLYYERIGNPLFLLWESVQGKVDGVSYTAK